MYRNHEGRFVVSIPLRQPYSLLGDSKEATTRQFLSQEKRLCSSPERKRLYTEFMTEYKVLEHMSLFQNATSNQVTYYSPHHGVLREDSVTTKLRVVFNCSFPSSSGHSYNSIQLTGPTIQEDLVSIRLRFRQHSYVISADHAIQATPTDSMALVSRRWTSNVFYQHSGLWHCKCSISCNQVSHAARNRPQ